MTNNNDPKRLERDARLRWVPITKMKVSPVAQRDLNQSRVDHLVSNFDVEQLGAPTVNERDDAFYIIDGQHRIEALRLLDYGQSVQCWTYTGLSEEEEADRFLKLNDYLVVHAMPRFKVAVTANRPVETDIDRIVRANGLVVSQDGVPGGIRAVGTLRRIYNRSDGKTLARTLRIVRDAFGDAGMEARVIDGVGLLCQRYNGQLDDAAAIAKLRKVNAGVSGLLNQAEKLRRSTGAQKAHCVAAAAVDAINTGQGGKKLPDWWKSTK